MKIGASVRYISSDDAFEVIVDLDPEQSLIEAIADTGISQHEAWDILDAWIVKTDEIEDLVDQIRDQRGDYLEALEQLADLARGE